MTGRHRAVTPPISPRPSLDRHQPLTHPGGAALVPGRVRPDSARRHAGHDRAELSGDGATAHTGNPRPNSADDER
jgi:hypothetical protein